MSRRVLVMAVAALSGLVMLLGLCDRGAGHEALASVGSADIVASQDEAPAASGGVIVAEAAAGPDGLPAPSCPASHDRVLDSVSVTSAARGVGADDRDLQPAAVASAPVVGSDHQRSSGPRGGASDLSAAVDRVSLCVDRS